MLPWAVLFLSLWNIPSPLEHDFDQVGTLQAGFNLLELG